MKIYIYCENISDLVDTKNKIYSSWYLWEMCVLMNDKLSKDVNNTTVSIMDINESKIRLTKIIWIEVI